MVQQETLERVVSDSQGFISALDERHTGRAQQFKEWLDKVSEGELQEKRRIAPGYLDTGARVLQPERHAATSSSEAPSSVVQGLEHLAISETRHGNEQ